MPSFSRTLADRAALPQPSTEGPFAQLFSHTHSDFQKALVGSLVWFLLLMKRDLTGIPEAHFNVRERQQNAV